MRIRYHLKKKEVQKVLKKAAIPLGTFDERVPIRSLEAVKIDSQSEIFLIDGVPAFLEINEEVFPTLLNKDVLEKLPTLTVDMGAVPHICEGADLMAPGIVRIMGAFQAGSIAVVVDERFSKPIALVKALFDSHELAYMKKGKVAKNLHYVDDKFWQTFKHIKNGA